MEFSNLVMKNIAIALHFEPTLKRWDAKNRADHIIGIALAGRASHDFGYQKFDIEKDCIFFLNKRDDFSCVVKEQSPCFSIHFTTFEEIETDSFCIKVKNTMPIISLFEKQLNFGVYDFHAAHSNFYRICSLFDDVYRKRYAKSDFRVDSAQEFLDLNFFRKDCLSDMYEKSPLSRRRLDELFREKNLITPARYITEKRIEHAKTLLRLPNILIQDVSELCGFSDVYYFSKIFKNETGVSPSSFRKL